MLVTHESHRHELSSTLWVMNHGRYRRAWGAARRARAARGVLERPESEVARDFLARERLKATSRLALARRILSAYCQGVTRVEFFPRARLHAGPARARPQILPVGPEGVAIGGRLGWNCGIIHGRRP